VNTAAALLMLQSALIGAGGVVALDLRAHTRTEQLGGVNIWGYRGRVAPQKAPNEIRVVSLGGDLAFGWGVAASETSIEGIRQLTALELDLPGVRLRRFTAINLGAMGLGASHYAERLRRFSSIAPDVVVVIVDPQGDRGRAWMPDETSTVARATGYVPMLPLVIDERQRSAPLRLLAAGFDRLDHATCCAESRADGPSDVARGVRVAVDVALGLGSDVVVVLPPYRSTEDVDMHLDVAHAVTTAGDTKRVRVVDIGDNDELNDDELWLDGVNLSVAGHAQIAQQVAPAVIALLRQKGL
jgi:hypothetical protein